LGEIHQFAFSGRGIGSLRIGERGLGLIISREELTCENVLRSMIDPIASIVGNGIVGSQLR
jgi:hypothetical protein